jgi:hypothetical protein
VANTLDAFRNGAAGFIDWLDRSWSPEYIPKIEGTEYDGPKSDCGKARDEAAVSSVKLVFKNPRSLERMTNERSETESVSILIERT